jgi:V/A-type H+-transporting ATPase subunit I
MILPMKKVYLVVQDKYRKDAMTMLRKTGVMHVEKAKPMSAGLDKANERMANAEEAMTLILPFKESKKQKKEAEEARKGTGPWDRKPTPSGKRGRRSTDLYSEDQEPFSLDAVNAPKRPDLVDLMLEINTERKGLEERQIILERERDRIAPWGEFNPAQITEMTAAGCPIYLYEISTDSFKEVPQDTRYIKISTTPVLTRFIVLDKEIPGVSPFVLPEKPLSQIKAELETLYVKKKALDDRIEGFANRQPVLKKEIDSIRNEIEFEETLATCEVIGDMPKDSSCCYLKGYILAEDMGKLKTAVKENGWALIADDPGEEDEPPTKLKNNRFVNLLEPITGFLDLTPGYRETDISLWFLVFLTIFFGMIFGDAGYGTLLFLISIFGISKTRKTGVPTILKVLLLFSISNITWGAFNCSWFGLDPVKILPPFFTDISLIYLSTAKLASLGYAPEQSQAFVNQNIKIICFSLALVHLSIAHIGRIFMFLRKGNLKFFADIGSIAMLLGMYNLILFLIASDPTLGNGLGFKVIPFHPYSLYLIFSGFGLSFLFGYYEGNILKAILSSLKNIFPVVLGVSGIFSDIMSFIRLWAVGLAGTAIAVTFNSLAGPMLGSFLIFLGVIVLAFGHGLNLVLCVLSVLVHGVRLNILEFSSHVGLSWAGSPFKPFKEN